MELKEFIKLSVNVLKDKTPYIEQKNLISDIFEKTENILVRLTIIDSLYSTQMNKRLYGLNDLANEIGKIKDLDKEIQNFKDNKPNKISKLLDEKYGIKKSGREFGQARSLISKYIYFATNYNFPIEDRLVKKVLNAVLKYFGYSEIDMDKNDILRELIIFCDNCEIKYSDFDNLLWLLGKIKEGSLASIVDKEKYEKIIEKLELSDIAESKVFDKKMAEKLKNINEIDKIKNLISNDFYEFLEFAKNIKIEK
ncbi:hypothetical protein [Campylobacter sp. JMF_08 NE1]|uniref:hypothetical protein n=1 Tax=Campylobacter sp. JMF_08 NE1 TaxID=2983821 RepID=UPI0022EA05E3|nr:hypothetical protein [Campylobacter sp. JMF_08 NE1]MDA3048377.1 hypothetical protein [Campylobacter sp. JMF_08 NE1]